MISKKNVVKVLEEGDNFLLCAFHQFSSDYRKTSPIASHCRSRYVRTASLTISSSSSRQLYCLSVLHVRTTLSLAHCSSIVAVLYSVYTSPAWNHSPVPSTSTIYIAISSSLHPFESASSRPTTWQKTTPPPHPPAPSFSNGGPSKSAAPTEIQTTQLPSLLSPPVVRSRILHPGLHLRNPQGEARDLRRQSRIHPLPRLQCRPAPPDVPATLPAMPRATPCSPSPAPQIISPVVSLQHGTSTTAGKTALGLSIPQP